VAVPEAPVHEDDGFPLRKDDVGRAWEISAVQPKAKTARVQASPEQDFGCRIASRHGLHRVPALHRRQIIDHRSESLVCVGS
jgi:hypothetical protein